MARRGRCRDAAAGRSPGVLALCLSHRLCGKDEEGREAMRHGRAQAWPRWCLSGARMPGPRWRASGTTSRGAGECPDHGRSPTTRRGAGRPPRCRPGRPRPIASARSGRGDPRNAGIVDRPGDRCGRRPHGGPVRCRCSEAETQKRQDSDVAGRSPWRPFLPASDHDGRTHGRAHGRRIAPAGRPRCGLLLPAVSSYPASPSDAMTGTRVDVCSCYGSSGRGCRS